MYRNNIILFLSNNENTQSLFLWLKNELKENVIKHSDKLSMEILKKYNPCFIISFNYKYIIKADIINYMQGNIINLHTSYLPYNKGSYPNFFSFLENTKKGVSIHVVDEKLDTGDILVQKEVFFDESNETFESTYNKLIVEIIDLFQKNWLKIKTGKIKAFNQQGVGSYHTSKNLEDFKAMHPFAWNEIIVNFKKKYRL